jgi:hypothetical protein
MIDSVNGSNELGNSCPPSHMNHNATNMSCFNFPPTFHLDCFWALPTAKQELCFYSKFSLTSCISSLETYLKECNNKVLTFPRSLYSSLIPVFSIKSAIWDEKFLSKLAHKDTPMISPPLRHMSRLKANTRNLIRLLPQP